MKNRYVLIIPALIAMGFGALAQTKDATSHPRHTELVVDLLSLRHVFRPPQRCPLLSR